MRCGIPTATTTKYSRTSIHRSPAEGLKSTQSHNQLKAVTARFAPWRRTGEGGPEPISHLPQPSTPPEPWRPIPVAAALTLGLALRLWWVHAHPALSGDPQVYADIARNWLTHGIYGVTSDHLVRPTLIRLPGYPLFLAICFRLFGPQNTHAVLILQVLVDLATCALLAATTRLLWSRRAAMVTLWLATLCPFTSTYSAALLTETLELFTIATAFFLLAQLVSNGYFTHLTNCAQTVKSVKLQNPPIPDPSTIQKCTANAAETISKNPNYFTYLTYCAQSVKSVRRPKHPPRLHTLEQKPSISGESLSRLSRLSPASQALSNSISGATNTPWLLTLLLALSWSYAALLRPDGALLAVTLCPALALYTRGRAWRLALTAGLLSVLPFIPWTIRNYHTFHTLEPLAPRYATDPGEPIYPGFQRWTKTVCVDFTCTQEIYWNMDSDTMNFDALPSRAFDTPAQYQATRQLFADYNQTTTLTSAQDAEFARLAAERIAAHPLRYYLLLPAARVADMLLRPRLELLPNDLRWWQYDEHEGETKVAYAAAAINLAYILLAIWGAARRPPLLGAMLIFLLLRSLLLATIEAPEQRYTLEYLPIFFILSGIALGGRRANLLPDHVRP